MSNKGDILTFTTLEHRWLSNMRRVYIRHGGITYPSTENFYQAMKYDKNDEIFVKLGDKEFTTSVRKYIASLSPYEAKAFSKSNEMTSKVFMENRNKIMLYAQREKYAQHNFRQKLILTGDCHIEEGNWWGDDYWGVDIETREGKNILGRLIMVVRDEIKGFQIPERVMNELDLL